MCRHLAYVGPPVTLQELLLEPPYGLLHQSWAPRRQRYGTVNADGFGAGWYAESRPEPARYRRAQPMWTDASFTSLAGVVRSRCVLAAVRSATAPSPAEESATAPFLHGRWLFSHNGAVEGFAGAGGTALLDRRARVEGTAVRAESGADAALLAALVFAELERGAALGPALEAVVAEVTSVAAGRLNLLLTDGTEVAATTWGDTLSVLAGRGLAGSGVLVASEPLDDDPGWADVPDLSLVVARPGDVAVRPLPAPNQTSGVRRPA